MMLVSADMLASMSSSVLGSIAYEMAWRVEPLADPGSAIWVRYALLSGRRDGLRDGSTDPAYAAAYTALGPASATTVVAVSTHALRAVSVGMVESNRATAILRELCAQLGIVEAVLTATHTFG